MLDVPAISIKSDCGRQRYLITEKCCERDTLHEILVRLLGFVGLNCHEQLEQSLTSSEFLYSDYSYKGMPIPIQQVD